MCTIIISVSDAYGDHGGEHDDGNASGFPSAASVVCRDDHGGVGGGRNSNACDVNI